MTRRVRCNGSTLSSACILSFSLPLFLTPRSRPTSPMRRSPRMIPSRTVFNHCKWIYIELAITGAHSGMGPLCISSAPDTSRQVLGECFPHFIPPYQRLQPLVSRNRLSFPALHPLTSSPVLPISFRPALFRFILFSLSFSLLRFKDLTSLSRSSLRRKPSLLWRFALLFLLFDSFP